MNNFFLLILCDARNFIRSSFLYFVSISVINIVNQNTVEIPNVTKASAQPSMRRQFFLCDYIHAYTYPQTHICTVRMEGGSVSECSGWI